MYIFLSKISNNILFQEYFLYFFETIKFFEINTLKEYTYTLARMFWTGWKLLTTDLSNLNSVFRNHFFLQIYSPILSNKIKCVYIYVGRHSKLLTFKTGFWLLQPSDKVVLFVVYGYRLMKIWVTNIIFKNTVHKMCIK